MIVGFAGPAGVGKSTCAQLIAYQTGWRVMSFADPLRELAKRLNPDWLPWHFGPGKDVGAPCSGVSPRATLRILGDAMKVANPDVFVQLAARRIGEATVSGDSVLIDDVRYPNEAQMIRDAGGTIVHVQRRGVAFRRDHTSELGLVIEDGDLVLHNPGTVEQVQGELMAMLSEITRRAALARAAVEA